MGYTSKRKSLRTLLLQLVEGLIPQSSVGLLLAPWVGKLGSRGQAERRLWLLALRLCHLLWVFHLKGLSLGNADASRFLGAFGGKTHPRVVHTLHRSAEKQQSCGFRWGSLICLGGGGGFRGGRRVGTGCRAPCRAVSGDAGWSAAGGQRHRFPRCRGPFRVAGLGEPGRAVPGGSVRSFPCLSNAVAVCPQVRLPARKPCLDFNSHVPPSHGPRQLPAPSQWRRREALATADTPAQTVPRLAVGSGERGGPATSRPPLDLLPCNPPTETPLPPAAPRRPAAHRPPPTLATFPEGPAAPARPRLRPAGRTDHGAARGHRLGPHGRGGLPGEQHAARRLRRRHHRRHHRRCHHHHCRRRYRSRHAAPRAPQHPGSRAWRGCAPQQPWPHQHHRAGRRPQQQRRQGCSPAPRAGRQHR